MLLELVGFGRIPPTLGHTHLLGIQNRQSVAAYAKASMGVDGESNDGGEFVRRKQRSCSATGARSTGSHLASCSLYPALSDGRWPVFRSPRLGRGSVSNWPQLCPLQCPSRLAPRLPVLDLFHTGKSRPALFGVRGRCCARPI